MGTSSDQLVTTDNPIGVANRHVTPHKNWNLVFPSGTTNQSVFTQPAVSLAPRSRDVEEDQSNSPLFVDAASGIAWFAADEGNAQCFAFLGSDAQGETINFNVFAARVVGKIAGRNHAKREAVTVVEHLIAGTATLGTLTGVAGGVINNTLRFADAISLGADSSLPTVGAQQASYTGGVARLWVDPYGAPIIGLHLARGTAASANAVRLSL